MAFQYLSRIIRIIPIAGFSFVAIIVVSSAYRANKISFVMSISAVKIVYNKKPKPCRVAHQNNLWSKKKRRGMTFFMLYNISEHQEILLSSILSVKSHKYLEYYSVNLLRCSLFVSNSKFCFLNDRQQPMEENPLKNF